MPGNVPPLGKELCGIPRFHLHKLLYLRILELKNTKWKGKGKVFNWQAVMNQLLIDERMSKRIAKYDWLI